MVRTRGSVDFYKSGIFNSPTGTPSLLTYVVPTHAFSAPFHTYSSTTTNVFNAKQN